QPEEREPVQRAVLAWHRACEREPSFLRHEGVVHLVVGATRSLQPGYVPRVEDRDVVEVEQHELRARTLVAPTSAFDHAAAADRRAVRDTRAPLPAAVDRDTAVDPSATAHRRRETTGDRARRSVELRSMRWRK